MWLPVVAEYRGMRRHGIVLAAIVSLAATVASAQFFRQSPDVEEAGPPEAEFHMARLAYFSPGCAGSRG
jgi:hypothetical protein